MQSTLANPDSSLSGNPDKVFCQIPSILHRANFSGLLVVRISQSWLHTIFVTLSVYFKIQKQYTREEFVSDERAMVQQRCIRLEQYCLCRRVRNDLDEVFRVFSFNLAIERYCLIAARLYSCEYGVSWFVSPSKTVMIESFSYAMMAHNLPVLGRQVYGFAWFGWFVERSVSTNDVTHPTHCYWCVTVSSQLQGNDRGEVCLIVALIFSNPDRFDGINGTKRSVQTASNMQKTAESGNRSPTASDGQTVKSQTPYVVQRVVRLNVAWFSPEPTNQIHVESNGGGCCQVGVLWCRCHADEFVSLFEVVKRACSFAVTPYEKQQPMNDSAFILISAVFIF